MLLLRATTLTDTVAAFADQLAQASGEAVAFALDGRHRLAQTTRHPIVWVTEAACQAAGLYCPSNFAWRCGDYPLYLARRQFPEARHIWQVEYDVRFSAGLDQELFYFFRGVDADLLAPDYQPAGRDWPWYFYCAGRDVTTYKCFFPLIRLAASAIDLLIEKRAAQGLSAQRRATWPNDEGFVATTLSQAGRVCRDINSFGPTFYSTATLTFDRPIEGASFDSAAVARGIYHPVLFGADYERKIQTLARGRRGRGLRSRLQDARLPLNLQVAW